MNLESVASWSTRQCRASCFMWIAVLTLLFATVYVNGTTSCKLHESLCHNNKCILEKWVCDRENDCGDYSDEEHCDYHRGCEDNEFKCADTDLCITHDWVCDGDNDCTDGSDEMNCSNITCTNDKFSCGANDQSCIPTSWVCDAHPDCPSGLDEKEETCKARDCADDEFKCSDNRLCISKRWMCDHDKDCADGSDEENCPPVSCAADQWQCKNAQCIPSQWRCDGGLDCADHSDELACVNIPPDTVRNCSSGEFACQAGHQCIHSNWVCDSDNDCEDGSDELNCPKHTCPPNYFLCGTGQCIPSNLVCDGKIHCDDESDEKSCPSSKKCDADTEFDCSGGRGEFCIPFSKHCDHENDCGNFEDEKDCNNTALVNPCSSLNGGCAHECVMSRTGFFCKCRHGYELDVTGKLCNDIDECLIPGTCSHRCHNREGSFKCSCNTGYELDLLDHTSCRAAGGEPLLLFANRHDLRQIHLHSGRYRSLVEGIRSAIAIDFDINADMLFWSDVDSEKISRATLDINGSAIQSEVLVSDDIHTPDGLACDWVHKNLYWTDAGNDRIEVLAMQATGRWRKTLMDTDLDEPRAIVVDPRDKEHRMYWTDWGQSPKIERAFLDGTSRSVIVSSNIAWPNGLTIDYESNRLFWVDAKLHIISSSDLDGLHRSVVLTSYSHLKHPFAITVFEDNVYWTDWHRESILKLNKLHVNHSGSEVTSIAENLVSPMDIRVYHKLKQPISKNTCVDKACSHICLTRPEYPGYSCLCPNDDHEHKYTMDLDGRTCHVTKIAHDDDDTHGDDNSHEEHTDDGSDPAVATVTVAVDSEHHGALSGQDPNKLSIILASVFIGFIILIIIIVVAVIFYRRYRKTLVKTMNFDNPVYRKTTTSEQMSLEKSEYQPSNALSPTLEPLTASSMHEYV